MLTKKDVFDTIAGAAIVFGSLYAGYWAGRKKAEWEEQGFDNRMDALQSRVSDLEFLVNPVVKEEAQE